ncbi:MAG: NADH-quinone oxidoreductase subunit J [Candidatus Sericytochromatia bacterium]
MFKDKSFLTTFTVFASAVLIVLLTLVFGSIGYGKDLAFYIIAGITVISALGVVSARNLVHSGFLLVLTFVMTAGIYVLLNADFLAAAQVLINGGAVTIMMIFAIMLTNGNNDSSKEPYSFEYKFVAFVLAGLGLFLVLMLRVLGISFNFTQSPFVFTTPPVWNIQEPVSINTTEKIGQMFFNQYLVPFEIASVVLLMALIGAIVLSMKDKDMLDTTATNPVPVALAEEEKAAEIVNK